MSECKHNEGTLTDHGDREYCVRCFEDVEEVTRPDHITMQQWRRLISAFDSVPVERREQFCEAVGQLARGYSA